MNRIYHSYCRGRSIVFLLSSARSWQRDIPRKTQRFHSVWAPSSEKSNSGGNDQETTVSPQQPQATATANVTSDASTNNTDPKESPIPPNQKPIVVFPWRHDESLLRRLQPDGGKQNSLLTSTNMSPGNPTLNAMATAYMFLDVPWYQFVFFGMWKDDLAESMSWAFTQGVARLLSKRAPQFPAEDIVKDSYELHFHETMAVNYTSSQSSSDEKAQSQKEDGVSLHSIFEPKLIDLYMSSSSTKSDSDDHPAETSSTTAEVNDSEPLTSSSPSSFEVCLQSVPYSIELLTLYSLPYLSRENVQSEAGFLEFYRNMMNKPSMDRGPDLNQLRSERLNAGTMESTVIAQTLVWCNEVFFVKKQTTKADDNEKEDDQVVIQGYGDAQSRNVPHLVRMEKTVKTIRTPQGTFHNEASDWKITDIDDLLDGNLIV